MKLITWAEVGPTVSTTIPAVAAVAAVGESPAKTAIPAVITVNQAALAALPVQTKLQLAYDPETPASVATALGADSFASVRAAILARPRVLKGTLKNPFLAVA